MKHVEDETWAAIEETLRRVDELCTAVISGKPGLMRLALGVAGCLSDLKRRKSVIHSST